MATKAQKAFAEQYLQDHPEIDTIFLNVNKNEWFTDKSYAENSRAKDKEGNRTDKLEIFARKQDITVEADVEDQGTGGPKGNEPDEKATGNQDPKGEDQGTGGPKGNEPDEKATGNQDPKGEDQGTGGPKGNEPDEKATGNQDPKGEDQGTGEPKGKESEPEKK